LPIGRSFDFIISKDQYENIIKVIARNGGRMTSERPVEDGIALRAEKSCEPED